MSSYYYTIQQYQDTWGVYLSPEIGVSIFPSPAQRFGFHVALFYSYASNNDDLLIYTMNNINRFGVRVGISFWTAPGLKRNGCLSKTEAAVFIGSGRAISDGSSSPYRP